MMKMIVSSDTDKLRPYRNAKVIAVKSSCYDIDFTQYLSWAFSSYDLLDVKPNDSGVIDVLSARGINKFASYTTDKNIKVCIVRGVELMNKNASNAILNVMQDGSIYFILITKSFRAIIPTIRSRCQAKVHLCNTRSTDALCDLLYESVISPDFYNNTIEIHKDQAKMESLFYILMDKVRLGGQHSIIWGMSKYDQIYSLYKQFLNDADALSILLQLVSLCKKSNRR